MEYDHQYMTTVVLGLDGGCFELIQPWIDDGSLPNFSKLIQDGVAEDMQSCLPPVTCPNWQCYATGTNPGKLGVFWWEGIDKKNNKIVNKSSAEDFHGTPYWNFLDGQSAIINLPTSYPPSEIDGIHVAGGPGAEKSGYTYPESLESELKEKYDYVIHPEKMSLLSKDDPENPCVEEIYDLIDLRFDLLESELARGEYELIHVTIFYLNVLQHFYWDMDVVQRAWIRIDERLGEILAHENLDNLFVMSDHGSNEIRTTFRINTWLEQNGYLDTESSVSDYLHRIGITHERIRPLLATLGLEWWARQLLPKRVQMYLPDKEGAVDKSGKEDMIDWEQSIAVGSGQGPVYVLHDDPAKREQVTSKLIRELKVVTDRDGNPVFDRVLRGKEIYSGKYSSDGPDIVLDQAPGVHIEGKIGNDSVFGTPDKWRGENKDTGMFIAYGTDIDKNALIHDMQILDLAPTILHLNGSNVPNNMDGEVRLDLFKPNSDPRERRVSRTRYAITDSSGGNTENREVTERLTDLGYME